MEEKLIIDRDNYEGYVELYKSKKNMYNNESSYLLMWIAKLFGTMGLGALVLAITTLIAVFISIPQTIIIFEMLALCSAEIVIGTVGIKNIFNKRKETLNAVKRKYPYIDIKIDDSELKESLIESKIITYKYQKDTTEILKVKEYENYLKAEEIKKVYLEETKYSGYVVNPGITEEELEKPKVRKLVR